MTNKARISRNIVVSIWRRSHENADDWFWKNNDCRRNELKSEDDDDVILFRRRNEKVIS